MDAFFPDFDKKKDAASYDRVASEYSRVIERLAGPLADRAVELADLRPGQRVLDVGTGTGLAALRAADAVGPAGSVVGIDLSNGMLGVAVETSRRRQLDHLDFRRMDAEALDLPDESFDAVLSLCAVAHFPNVAAALSEMKRVLRPGCRVVVAIGCARPPFGRGVLRYLRERTRHELQRGAIYELRAPGSLMTFVRDRVGEAPHEEEEAPWTGHHPTRQLARLVRAAGFREVRTSWTGQTVTFDSPEDFWDAQSSVATPVRKLLASVTPEDVSTIQTEFVERARRTLALGGRLSYPYGAFFVAGES